MVKAPAAGADFKAQDASSYDRLGETFDALVSRFCVPFADRIVHLAEAGPSQRILDVGTGSGVVALRAAARVGPQGEIVGVDLSEGMLQTARRNATRAGLHQATFHRMDAEALELPDGSFDRVLSLFALTHFPNPLAALTEMHRVLRPGGRLVLGVGGGPPLLSRHGLRACGRRLQRGVLEWRGRQLTAPHFLDALVATHLPGSGEPEETTWAARKLNRAAIARRFVKAAGFRDLAFDWLQRQAVLDTADEFWEIQATWSSLARKRLRDASAEQVAALRHEFRRRCDTVRSRGGRLVYPLAAWFVTARKR